MASVRFASVAIRDLNTTDRLILAKLQEGRAKPAYLASELGKQQPYISNRLKELVEAGYVVQLYRGLYGHAALEDGSIDAEHLVHNTTDEALVTGEFDLGAIREEGDTPIGPDTATIQGADGDSSSRASEESSETELEAGTDDEQADSADMPGGKVYDPTEEH